MKIPYTNYKHLSFDLWLTLIQSHPEFKGKRNQLFKDFFEIEAPLEKVAEVIRKYDVLSNNINEKTGLNFDTFQIYYLILSALNVNLDTVDSEKLSCFYTESENLFMTYKPTLLYADTAKLFKEITSQEKTINILSNTAFIKGKTLRKLLAYYDLETSFLFQIYSDEVGFSKPNQKIFQLVYDQLSQQNIQKNEVLHIGDNEIADYKGALHFGFDAFLLK